MPDSTKPSPILSRRRVFAAGGTVGALAAAAAAVPFVKPSEEPAPVAAKPQADGTSAGYRETAHVLRYYQTTRV